MLDRLGQYGRVGVLGRDDPRSPGAVQADGYTVLAGDRAELGDRRTRPAGDGQAEPRASVNSAHPAA